MKHSFWQQKLTLRKKAATKQPSLGRLAGGHKVDLPEGFPSGKLLPSETEIWIAELQEEISLKLLQIQQDKSWAVGIMCKLGNNLLKREMH